MIPKVIHYCWFGPNAMPKNVLQCIDSWHRHMPQWDYRLWNESTFAVDSVAYTREAYAAGKYAFVSDYVRLFALKNEGGVYMDTDVVVLKSIEGLLHLGAFTGYEGSKHLPPVTGIMASEANGEWVTEQLEAYRDAHFLLPDGSYDITTNTQRISRIMQANGFVSDGRQRKYKDLTVFPVDYFSPRQTTGEYLLTDNTYCDHLAVGSWCDSSKHRSMETLRRIIGNAGMARLIKFKRFLCRERCHAAPLSTSYHTPQN